MLGIGVLSVEDIFCLVVMFITSRFWAKDWTETFGISQFVGNCERQS